MTEGELLQLTTLGRTDISEEQYFDILKRKTAFLFSACCEIGAIMGGADPDLQRALRDYGMNLGMAFQLVDDLLDFTATEEALGKAAGADLLEGKLTLPLILLLRSDPSMRESVQTVMRDGHYRNVQRETLLKAVEETGALSSARESAYKYADSARDALYPLPDSVYCDALRSIPTFIVERDS
jgi:octaprenyl-diphosphate synthase